MALANDKLLSLFWQPAICKSLEPFPGDRTIADMTALTRLELVRFNGRRGVKPLCHLPLVELVLIDCPAMTHVFFGSGALTALQKLHIEETQRDHGYYNRALMYNSASELMNRKRAFSRRQEMRWLGRAILSLPCLHQLSGQSRVFDEGMAGQLASWCTSDYDVNSKHALPSLKATAWRSMKVWRRP